MHHGRIASPRVARRRVGDGTEGRATLADVAAAAGVSQMTVSRVVNGGPASDKARRAVLQAVEQLGYEPNQAARALASRPRHRRSPAAGVSAVSPIAVVDLWNPFGSFLSEMCKPRS